MCKILNIKLFLNVLYFSAHSNLSQYATLQQPNSCAGFIVPTSSVLDVKSNVNQPRQSQESTTDINTGSGTTYGTRIPQVYSNFINPNVQFQPR